MIEAPKPARRGAPRSGASTCWVGACVLASALTAFRASADDGGVDSSLAARLAADAGPEVTLRLQGVLEAMDARVQESEKIASESKDRSAALQAQLEALKAEVTQLARDKERAASKNGELSSKVDKLNRTVEDIRTLLANDADSRESQVRAAAESSARRQAAIDAIESADDALASGDTSGVEAALRAATGTIPDLGAKYLDLARKAYKNNDLASTRAYLRSAMGEALRQR